MPEKTNFEVQQERQKLGHGSSPLRGRGQPEEQKAGRRGRSHQRVQVLGLGRVSRDRKSPRCGSLLSAHAHRVPSVAESDVRPVSSLCCPRVDQTGLL